MDRRDAIYIMAFTTLDLTVKTRNFGSSSMIAIVNATLGMNTPARIVISVMI